MHSAKHPFDPITGFRGAFIIAATPLALAGFCLGASLLGADYTSRALTTLLTWEPRRSRVLGARAIACALVTAGLSLATLLALTLALLPTALAHGTGVNLTTSGFASASAAAVRCALLAAAASVAGVSLAALGRSTAAAILALVVYLVVVEQAANGARAIGLAMVDRRRLPLLGGRRSTHRRRRARRVPQRSYGHDGWAPPARRCRRRSHPRHARPGSQRHRVTFHPSTPPKRQVRVRSRVDVVEQRAHAV